MARKTVIRHPDGTVTEITTSSSVGRGCSAIGWAFLVLFLVAAPAAWWGVWSVPAYVALVGLFAAGFVNKVRSNRSKGAQGDVPGKGT